MGASMVAQRSGVDLSSLNINVPPLATPGFNSGREAQYARRIRELEDELREVKLENAKQVNRVYFLLDILLTGRSENDDCEVSGEVGETQGVSEAEEREQGGSRCR